MYPLHVFHIFLFSCVLLHVTEVSDVKWKCSESGETSRRAKGSETIKRKVSDNFGRDTVWFAGGVTTKRVDESKLYSDSFFYFKCSINWFLCIFNFSYESNFNSNTVEFLLLFQDTCKWTIKSSLETGQAA